MKHFLNKFLLFWIFFGISISYAQLAVTVHTPCVAGQKAVVPIAMRNDFNQDIKSARAVCFLIDDRGRMVGQSAKWVVGGGQRTGLMAGGTNSFNFVFNTSLPPGMTNLVARVVFNRVILENGTLVDTIKDVHIAAAAEK